MNQGENNQRERMRRIVPGKQEINQNRENPIQRKRKQKPNNSLLKQAIPYLIGGGSTGIGIGISLSEITDYFL